MKFIASMHAYDALDKIAWHVTVREYQDYEDGPSVLVVDRNGLFPGWGEHDASHWLLGVLEDLTENL